MRYGLIDGQQRTLEEIGVAFRVTRERVRQIEARALHKIKQPYRCHKLRDHVNVNKEVISVFGYRNDVEEPEPFVAPPPPPSRGRARRASGSTASAGASAGVEAGVLVSTGGASAGRRRRSSSSSRGKASAAVEYAFSGRSNNATLAG
jgi:hypothetical protein